MIHGVILTDNTFNNLDITCSRGSGAHKIATHLRQHGYNIEVVDYCLSWTQSELINLFDKLITEDTLFLGIGSNLFLDRTAFDDTIRWFKTQYPNVKIILGGNQVLTRTIPCVDYYVEGYAENSILVLLDYLRGKITKDAIRWSPYADNLIDSNSDYGPVDTNDLTIDYLSSDFIPAEQTLGLETARGCIFKCKFCTYPLLGKKKIDYIRSPDTIVRELQQNYDKWGTTNYLINEDTFNDSIEKLELLEQAITRLPFKIQFTAYARLDLILAKPQSVELLRNMGMRGVHFGIETFNTDAGKIVGKGQSGSKVKDGLMWWKEQMPHVATVASMIVGLPGDTSDYHAENEWFSTSGVDYWYWQPLYITKGDQTIHTSEFTRSYNQYGLELMSEQEVRRELNYLWKLEFKYRAGASKFSYRPFIDDNFRGKVGYWKNVATGDNYFKSVKISCELNRTAQNRRVSAWTMFDYTSLGYDIEEVRSWGHGESRYPSEPTQQVMAERALVRTNEYKQNKQSYDYANFYKDLQQPIKRFIPIRNDK